MSSSYIPGMCNINDEEVAYRKKAMWFGIALSLAVLTICIVTSLNGFITAAILFMPVFIAAIGFLQVRNKFCVSYGSKGQQNAEKGSKSSKKVTDLISVKADKKKAVRMNTQALGITIIVLIAAGLVTQYVPF